MIQPILRNAVVTPLGEEETQSGLIVTQNQQEVRVGEVIAVGPGESTGGIFTPSSVNVGDKVLFKTYSPIIKIPTQGINGVYVISNEEILGIIK